MASALAKWQLKRISARLKVLREELRIIDEQRSHLVDDADDLGLRAVVSDSPLARSEAHAAGGHAAAIEGARVHVVDEISRLERRQDMLLDRITGG